MYKFSLDILYHNVALNIPIFFGPQGTFMMVSNQSNTADKSLARPGRKQATATEYFDFHISYF